MHSFFLIKLLFLLSVLWAPVFGQNYYAAATSSAAAATSSLSPADMSASSVFASLATATPQQTSGEGGGPGEASAQGGTGNAAGASGSDTTSFSLSRGGMIAIIVVVVVVAIFGSKSPQNRNWLLLLTKCSCLIRAFLSCKEEVLGSPSNYQEIREESSYGIDTTSNRVPEQRETSEEELEEYV
jgi:hypothetical protein